MNPLLLQINSITYDAGTDTRLVSITYQMATDMETAVVRLAPHEHAADRLAIEQAAVLHYNIWYIHSVLKHARLSWTLNEGIATIGMAAQYCTEKNNLDCTVNSIKKLSKMIDDICFQYYYNTRRTLLQHINRDLRLAAESAHRHIHILINNHHATLIKQAA